MSSDVRHTIREYLKNELAQDRPDFALADDMNLLTTHVIDSLGIFTLITFLEEQYGIAIDADEVVSEHFETVTDIERLVETKLEAAAATSSA